MRKFLLYSSALVLGLSEAAQSACIQTPTCSSLGYTSSSACTGGVKCPFGNAWNCSVNEIKTELTNKITELETQITELKKEMVTSNCQIGDILYSDMSCNATVIASKTPIGVVFDRADRLAIGLEQARKSWSSNPIDVPGLTNSESDGLQGKKNTQIVLEYCKANGKSCPAFEYVSSYKTEGTQAGDWYLPTSGELNVIYVNMDVLNIALGKIGGGSLSSYYKSYYWSSSDTSSYSAWYFDFYDGYNRTGNKDEAYLVRPVLAY